MARVDAQRFARNARDRGSASIRGTPIAAFEDPLYYLQRERQLPINVDPVDNHLDDPGERERLRRVFERGLENPTGMCCRCSAASARTAPNGRPASGCCAAQHLFLVPGDSPLGLRLPLSSLPWVAPSEAPQFFPVDPMAAAAATSPGSRRDPALQSRGGDERDKKPAPGESAPWIVRTALCVEPRDGRLYVFMPPQSSTEDYLDLLAAIEDTAAHLGTPVVIEGYTPPPDYRVNRISVTPDPGVIEVNVHPAHNWSELVNLTTTLYEDARQCRLGHREIHARRTAYRHRRRQSLRPWRGDARRQPLPAPSRSAA